MFLRCVAYYNCILSVLSSLRLLLRCVFYYSCFFAVLLTTAVFSLCYPLYGCFFAVFLTTAASSLCSLPQLFLRYVPYHSCTLSVLSSLMQAYWACATCGRLETSELTKSLRMERRIQRQVGCQMPAAKRYCKALNGRCVVKPRKGQKVGRECHECVKQAQQKPKKKGSHVVQTQNPRFDEWKCERFVFECRKCCKDPHAACI